MLKKSNILIYLVIILIAVVLDQLTKNIAKQNLEFSSITIIENFFYFILAYNTGAAWSILEGKMNFFYVTTIIVFGTLTYFIYKSKSQFFNVGAVMCIGGGLGNFIDRVLYSKVTDFISFIIFGYNFPIFNIADIFVTTGGIIIAIHFLFSKDQLLAENDQL